MRNRGSISVELSTTKWENAVQPSYSSKQIFSQFPSSRFLLDYSPWMRGRLPHSDSGLSGKKHSGGSARWESQVRIILVHTNLITGANQGKVPRLKGAVISLISQNALPFTQTKPKPVFLETLPRRYADGGTALQSIRGPPSTTKEVR